MVKSSTKYRSMLECITSVYILLLCVVFLLYPGSRGYESIQTAKYNLFLVLCGGYVGLITLLLCQGLLVGETSLRNLGQKIRSLSWPQRGVLFYLLFTWLSARGSPYWPHTIFGVSRQEGALTITLYCLCFLLVSLFGKPKPWMLWCFGGAVLLFDCICILQLLGRNPLWLFPAGYNYFDANTAYSGAFIGTIGNADFSAAFLCIAASLFWATSLRQKGKNRLLCVAVTFLTLVVLLFTNVLAGIVGLFGGCLLSLPMVFPFKKRGRILSSAVALGLPLLALIALFCMDVGTGFLHEIHQLLHGSAEDSFGSGRIYIWRNVLKLSMERPLFGYGPDTMALADIAPFSRFDQASGTQYVAYIDAAHNEYLNVFFHQGILALLSYIGALIAALIRWFRTGMEDPVAAMLGCAVFCHCIQSFFGISTCMTAPFFWLAFALLEKRNGENEIKIIKRRC